MVPRKIVLFERDLEISSKKLEKISPGAEGGQHTSPSDHDLICVTRKINTQKYPARVMKCRDYSKYNPELLVNDIRLLTGRMSTTQ